MTKITKKIPKRRFKTFKNAEAWEQRKLEALCELFTDGDWIEAKDQSNSGVRLVQTGNVGTAEYLDKENNKKWISEDTFEKLHCEEIYEGDILISRLPEPAGRACIMPNLGTRMITAVDCTIIRTAKEFDSKYLVQYLTTPMYFKVVNSFLGGGTRQRISRGNLSSIDIPIPSTLEEQKRIGQYFANLDNLITLHQRKLDKLKNVKKAYLSELFPAEGEREPKRRFPGFTDAWEQRKLGEVASYRRGSFPQPYGKSEWYGGEYAKPFVQVADVADSMCLVKDTKQKISLLAQPLSVFAEKGSVLVTLQGSIGRVAIIQYGAFIDRTILIFEKYKIDIDNVFWAYIIKQKFVEEALKAPGGTIKTITKEALSDFDLRLPNFEEQTQIGTFFFALDSLITLHQRKLDKLKDLKKAYLNELFV
ncbi:restriction endonuclease subunit S [Streptococcus sp. ZJ93]|uniref:restriction endonuclease subunit S n=1 Tax=Streptococcus handemini TaxID=3161188 RepID=UPI0034D3A182